MPIPAMTDRVVPAPVVVEPTDTPYWITSDTEIRVDASHAEAKAIGERLAALLRPSTGYRLPVVDHAAGPAGGILLSLSPDATLPEEGYHLEVTSEGVAVRATAPAGLFYGVQTLRQLLPANVEARTRQPGPWGVPGGRIVDYPRFAYRGAMLDVARRFFSVADIERYLDEISFYKVNVLHLHLTDDQGWRIVVNSWPNLTDYGGSTEVGGGAGGYYTQAEYQHIVACARQRGVTIVPEIDGPGHTNAALASYAQLNCDGVAPPLYTGIEVGFSSLCVDKEITYSFCGDVLGEIAALTPGPYLHIGGDEAQSTSPEDYATYLGKLLPIVQATGKLPMGWHEITNVADLPSTAVAEYWGTSTSDQNVAAAAARGTKIVLAPADRTYLDQKYYPTARLGLNWAACIEVQDAYDWDPGAYLDGVAESSVLGVEAPLWAETLATMADIEYLAFPRLPAVAELGWSSASTHNWPAFRQRLAAHGPRWTEWGLNFYVSPQIPWAAGTRSGGTNFAA